MSPAPTSCWAARGPRARMGDAMRWLEGVVDHAEGQLDAPLEALGRAMVELGEAAHGVETALEGLISTRTSWNGSRNGCSRSARWRASTAWRPTNCPASARPARAAGGAGRGRRRHRRAGRGARWPRRPRRAAEDLSAARGTPRPTARRGDGRTGAAEDGPGGVPTGIVGGRAGPDGADQVAFEVATNPGAPAGPLARSPRAASSAASCWRSRSA